MMPADFQLACRLEATEAYACAQYAVARQRLDPSCGAEWRTCGGATVVFDGVDSPCTQTFGLGMFEPVTDAVLEEIERFFVERGAPVHHEVCPLAGVEALDLLCRRGYRPIEIASVLAQEISELSGSEGGAVTVRTVDAAEMACWTDVSARAWSHDKPELLEFMRAHGAILSAREGCVRLLAEIDGQPAGAGALTLHNGVALMSGAATLPAFRRRGVQSALLAARMRMASEAGCALVMIAAEAGGESQRNAERNGFRIAYTRVKWMLKTAASAPWRPTGGTRADAS
jgi:GNAT superfamily N-acetyltransferase